MALQRIVKLTFKPEHCNEFENFFAEIKDQVGNQPGCSGVNLLRETGSTGVYFTYSNWDKQTSLDAYRNTDLFNVVWPKVKAWFAAKPEAWSTEIIASSKPL
jgi:quinol monooxygenase YgiN